MAKAWFYKEYGSLDVLQFGEIPVPSVGPGQVLIKVRAAALNPVDYKIRQYGFARSADAPWCRGLTYTVAKEHLLALKPSNLSFEDAASLPLALLTALLAFDTVDFEKGQSVFIVGGAGGVGSLAIQLAKHVFEVFDQVDEKFDFVFDTVGESSKSYVVAKEEGKIVDIASFPPHPRVVNVRLSQPQGSDLERLGEYIESGKLKPVIDPKSPYAFSDVVEAFKHLESGRARGKIIVSPI